MEKLRVLVIDADTPKSLAIVRALGAEHDVWTASKGRLALAAWSRHTRQHLTYDFTRATELPDWVLLQCLRNQIQVVIPPEESSALLLARQARQFAERGVHVAALPIEALERVVDKTKTLAAAIHAGIPVPATKILERTSDLMDAARELGYPVVIKPRSTQYWDGTQFRISSPIGYANSDQQLRKLAERIHPQMPPPIVQEFVPGEGVGVCMLIGNKGEVLAEFAHRRLRDYRPTGSGSVLRQSIGLPADLSEKCARLLRHIGCRGVAMVELRMNSSTGEVYLMEVNGRFWGSLQLAIDSGVNFPALLVDWITGKQVRKPSYKEGVVVRWWVGDFIRTLRVLRGRPAGFTGSFPSRLSAVRDFLGPQPLGTRNEILRRNDYWPSLIEPISMMRKLIA